MPPFRQNKIAPMIPHSKPKAKTILLHPRYWPAWAGLGVLWMLVHLPERLQLGAGRLIGRLLYGCGGKLKRIARINLALCFPELTSHEQAELLYKNFLSLGIGLIEAGRAFWLSDDRISASCTIRGMEHATAAFAKGKGILLISPHFTCLETVGRILGMREDFAVMYRPHKKPLLEWIHNRFRNPHYRKSIPSHRVRELLRALSQNLAVWYAYDIDAGKKNSVFAPFFGLPAASMTSVSRLAELSGAAIVPVHFYRRDGFRYEACVAAALDDFPSGDPVKDATHLNASLETAIRAHPEQYIWQYQRWKTRPEGEQRFYVPANPESYP